MLYRGLGLVIALAGCLAHGPAIPALPSKGGPAWVEVASAHFVIWTDSSEARARALAQQMEDDRRIVIGVLFDGTEPNAPPTLVLALRDAEETGAYVPGQFVAYASGGGPVLQPIIVVAADADGLDNHIFVHELTHAITHGVIAHQPHWFAEGLAQYFETLRIQPDVVEIGHPNDSVIQRLRHEHPQPAAAVFACEQAACMDPQFYATTWAMFADLASAHTKELLHYMNLLATSASTAQASAAWRDAFPQLSPAQFDHELLGWLMQGRTLVIRLPFRSEKAPVVTRPLVDADALAARAIMRWVFAPKAPQTRVELAAAVAADPTHVLARLLDAAVTNGVTIEQAKAVAAAHPMDWRAWWLVGRVANWGPEAGDARIKICALVGTRPPAILGRGFCPSAS